MGREMQKYFARPFSLILAIVFPIAHAFAAGEQLIPREEVKIYYKVMQRMDSKLGNLFSKLVSRYGLRDSYTPDQIQWPLGPKKSKEDLIYPEITKKRELPTPSGAISVDDTHRMLKVHAARTGSTEDLIKALVKKYGYRGEDQMWYLASELRDVLENGVKSAKINELPPPAEVALGLQPILDGLYHFKLRQSWSDVLYSEDPSVEGAKTKVGDLVGASFSFVHDYEADTNTWSAVGALIFPMEWRNEEERDLIPDRLIFAPSVSINRLSSSDPSKKEIDQLYYRLGVISKWVGPKGWLDTVQLRSALVYGTDLEHRARLPAYEADLEPAITWLGINDVINSYFKIGFQNVLIHKKPELPPETDVSQLDYQLRAWLHLEGGDLQRAGTTWNVVEGSFFRIGPAVQLRLNAPTLWKGISLTALYSYLPSVNGPTMHNMLFKVDGTVTLYNDPASNQKISLNANYTRGGLDFTKQEVDTFTLGLSVLF